MAKTRPASSDSLAVGRSEAAAITAAPSLASMRRINSRLVVLWS